MIYNPFEQALLTVLFKSCRKTDTGVSEVLQEYASPVPPDLGMPPISAAEEKSARLYLDAVAGAAAPDSPFTVYYPASNQAELIVRQSFWKPFRTERTVFAAECTPIVKKLERIADFLSYLLDTGRAQAYIRSEDFVPLPPDGIGTVWRRFRGLPKSLIYDLCFFRRNDIIPAVAALDECSAQALPQCL